MKVKFEGICRGSQKIFALCDFGQALSNPISVSAISSDGKPVPASLYPYVSSSAGEPSDRFVLCLPIIAASYYDLTFHNGDETCAARLSSKRAKWKSRINYKTLPALCRSIRDYDAEYRCLTATIGFDSCVEAKDSYVLRGCVELPYQEDNDLFIRCYTQALEQVSFDYTLMGFSEDCGEWARSRLRRRRISFSVRMPKELQSYILCVGDNNHPAYNAYDVLTAECLAELRQRSADFMRDARFDPRYPEWFKQHRATAGEIREQSMIKLSMQPKFSIVVPLFNTPTQFFKEMCWSVRRQSYSNWELILVNASPENDELCGLVRDALDQDARILAITLEKNLGISENTNAGIERATGDFVCFLDHDDVLEPSILFEYVRAINEHKRVDLLYCDEDKLLPDGSFMEPHFKPDFNLDLLRNNNYICHMLAIRKTLLDSLEPNTRAYDGAQDHNLTLRAIEKTDAVYHVPRVLYHWRISPSSTANGNDKKSYAITAGIKSVQEHLDRMGLRAHVSLADVAYTYRVIYDVPENHPLVSVIIPNKDHIDMLDRCLTSIFEKTTYDNYEILIIENNSTEPATFEYYEQLAATRSDVVRVVRWSGEFNFSKLMNFGRAESRGDYLLLLNNDTEVITPEWMSIMLGLAARSDVGAVGVRLFYPDDTIQHAGVVVRGGVAGHLSCGLPRGTESYFALNCKQQDLSAVTAACLMTSRESFDAVGGFTEELAIAFNDVDYCLKLREKGMLVVYTPEVELYHYESVSRGLENNWSKRIRFHREWAYMNRRWASYYAGKGDPYVNPNFMWEDQLNRYYKLP